MENEYLYDAFISYRHTELDKAIADKLQRLLERYVPPVSATGGKKVPKLRIFRDETELPTSSNLSEDISTALKKSRFLIVLCSKTTSQSRWCMQEIKQFKELHGGSVSNILTLLTEGEPADVFPKELCTETRTVTNADGSTHIETIDIEPLAGNVAAPALRQSLRKLNREFLRIAAPLYGCGYDMLYNRNQRRFIRRMITIAASLIAFLIAFGIYSTHMIIQISNQRDETELQRAQADEQRTLAEQNMTLAMQKEEEAVNNLNYAKSLLLSNAIDFAADLNMQGARSRAGSILRDVYENIDPGWPDADMLYTKFRDTVLNTMYYMDDTLPFAIADIKEEIKQIKVMPGQCRAIVLTASALYCIDTDTGDILFTYTAPAIEDQSDESPETFAVCGVYDTHVYAVTNFGRLITADTENGTMTVETDNIARYYEDDNVLSAVYNELISSIVIITVKSGRFIDQPGSLTYIEADENEIFTKVILTILPFNFDSYQTHTDPVTVVFKADTSIDFDPVRISENNRFIALRNNFETFLTEDGIEGNIVNSNISLIDIENYNSLLTANENSEAMIESVDCRFNEENEFLFMDFAISDRGYLTLDGIAVFYADTTPAESRRTIVYDSINTRVIFNEQLTDDTNYFGSRIIPVTNQFLFSEDLHWLSNDDLIAAISPDDPDYEIWLNEQRGKMGTLTTDKVITISASSDDWLVFLAVEDESTVLKIYRPDKEDQLFAEHELPRNFDPKLCYFYAVDTYDSFIFVQPHFAVLGTESGSNKGLLVRNPFFPLGSDYTGEFFMPDIAVTSVASDLSAEIMLVGFKDGRILFFNRGRSPAQSGHFDAVDRVSSGVVYSGNERTGVVLEQVTEALSINEISYSKNRDFVFGYEDDYLSNLRVFSIWNMEDGGIVKSFYSNAFIGDESYSSFHMRINSDFTYAVASDRSNIRNHIYYTVDVISGETLSAYRLPVEVDLTSWELTRRDGIFYGIGSSPDIVWFFNEETLVLRLIDMNTGSAISTINISERVDVDTLSSFFLFGGVSSLQDVMHEIGSDLVIFIGSGGSLDGVYSLASNSMIFTGSVVETDSDCSAIYIGNNYERIILTAEELYDTLSQYKHISLLSEADITATGLNIFR